MPNLNTVSISALVPLSQQNKDYELTDYRTLGKSGLIVSHKLEHVKSNIGSLQITLKAAQLQELEDACKLKTLFPYSIFTPQVNQGSSKPTFLLPLA